MSEPKRKRYMVCQPFDGVSEELHKHNVDAAAADLNTRFADSDVKAEAVDAFSTDEAVANFALAGKYGVVNTDMFFMSLMLGRLSTCDGIYLCKGWGLARQCNMAHMFAMTYSLDILYEDTKEVSGAAN